ncbi:helix-turn-helix transcriptional regulator [Vibrio parahaemolyticus]|jgi:predicted DNA-binding transcriptional regulator AlpA|uniref:helix-turn-helix transcriptional regulator n=1 Tax=Vibrio TaxID=662 RepID=UPI001CDC0CB3|nr:MULTISPECIES: helix-turn-helix domain-containing protein [Vibrio]EGR0763352.1 DNA-binding protein [Vibrio parahaemolyticus]MCA2497823.1 helix-turn-helix domain-containing protein [Vibrio alginolyticus]MDF5166514.1 helix-turn-helix domain-containing protein [Vibrio parahaemolyticus]MDW2217510.1 helix-turn-helix domain-containing protein [Vibrio sp. 2175-1]
MATQPKETERILISDKEVREMFGISQPTLWRWTKNDGFPAAIVRAKRSRKQVMDWAREKNML